MFKQGKRNGVIDLIRIVFCFMLALGHWGRFPNSYLVVEYFFIVSGFFMCVSASKDDNPICEGTWIFIKKESKTGITICLCHV